MAYHHNKFLSSSGMSMDERFESIRSQLTNAFDKYPDALVGLRHMSWAREPGLSITTRSVDLSTCLQQAETKINTASGYAGYAQGVARLWRGENSFREYEEKRSKNDFSFGNLPPRVPAGDAYETKLRGFPDFEEWKWKAGHYDHPDKYVSGPVTIVSV